MICGYVGTVPGEGLVCDVSVKLLHRAVHDNTATHNPTKTSHLHDPVQPQQFPMTGGERERERGSCFILFVKQYHIMIWV